MKSHLLFSFVVFMAAFSAQADHRRFYSDQELLSKSGYGRVQSVDLFYIKAEIRCHIEDIYNFFQFSGGNPEAAIDHAARLRVLLEQMPDTGESLDQIFYQRARQLTHGLDQLRRQLPNSPEIQAAYDTAQKKMGVWKKWEEENNRAAYATSMDARNIRFVQGDEAAEAHYRTLFPN